jgi:hypothetical protein
MINFLLNIKNAQQRFERVEGGGGEGGEEEEEEVEMETKRSDLSD